jgi:hypothetical protein
MFDVEHNFGIKKLPNYRLANVAVMTSKELNKQAGIFEK